MKEHFPQGIWIHPLQPEQGGLDSSLGQINTSPTQHLSGEKEFTNILLVAITTVPPHAVVFLLGVSVPIAFWFIQIFHIKKS